MGETTTINLGLRKPEYRDPITKDAWHTPVNTNMDKIDAAFGNRNYTEQYCISNSDSHSESLNKIDIYLHNLITGTILHPDIIDALEGEGPPSITNKFVTKNYVRFARKEILFPEFESATFTLSGGSNTGELSTNVEYNTHFTSNGNYLYNHYKWVSEETGEFHSYDISIQWKVPETFEGWNADALIVDICTEENTTTNNKVVVILSNDGVSATPVESDDFVSTDPELWCSEREGTEVIAFADSDIIGLNLVAGSTLNILIKMSSWNNKYVKIGAITIQYTG